MRFWFAAAGLVLFAGCQPAGNLSTAPQSPPSSSPVQPAGTQPDEVPDATMFAEESAPDPAPAEDVESFLNRLERSRRVEPSARETGVADASTQSDPAPEAIGEPQAAAGHAQPTPVVVTERTQAVTPRANLPVAVTDSAALPPPMDRAMALAAPRVLSLTLLQPVTVQDTPSTDGALAIHRGLDLAVPSQPEHLAAAIEKAELALADDPSDAVKQWRLSLLQIAAGDAADAAQLSPAIVREARDLLAPALLIAAAAGEVLDEPAQVSSLGAPVENLRRTIRQRGELQISEVTLCTRVVTFGVYEPLAADVFLPYRRNRAVVYIALRNFHSERSGDAFRTLLSLRLELFEADGQSLWVQERERIEDESRQRREDFFLAQIIELPANLGPGDYVLKATVNDLLAQKTNGGTYAFTIKPVAEP